MKRGDKVCVRFGRWDYEWGVFHAMTRFGNIIVRLAPLLWPSDVLMEVLPHDIVEQHSA